jgi:hypothetical protein
VPTKPEGNYGTVKVRDASVLTTVTRKETAVSAIIYLVGLLVIIVALLNFIA